MDSSYVNNVLNRARFALQFVCMLFIVFHHASAMTDERIDPYSGRLLLSEIDLSFMAGAVRLELNRSLLPNKASPGLLGSRWRTNWESRLVQAGDAIFIQENAGAIEFQLDADKQQYNSADGQMILLLESGHAIRELTDGTKKVYDTDGLLVQHELRNGNTIFLIYDDKGQLSKVEGPGGRYLRLVADTSGRLVSATASTGDTITYEYSGELLSRVRHKEGASIDYSYDGNTRLISVDHPVTGQQAFTYDDSGRILSRRWADGGYERWEYDDNKLIRRYIDQMGAVVTSRWSRDRRTEKITDPRGYTALITYDNATRPISIVGASGAIARINYDNLGRVKSVTNPLGQATQFEYRDDSGQVTRMQRPDGSNLTYRYDDQHNLTTVQSGDSTILAYTYTPDGQVASTHGVGMQQQRYTYTDSGEICSIVDIHGMGNRFKYDERDNLIEAINALGGITKRLYDSQGRLTSEIDPTGAEANYSYDERGRLISISGPDKAKTRYEYDDLSRLLAETDPVGRQTRYRYNLSGSLSSVTFPDGSTENYAYDTAGNLINVTDAWGHVARYDYDPIGRLSGERHPGGLVINYRYDKSGRLLSTSDNTDARTEYAYNLMGEVDQLINSTGGKARYRYDQMGNLTELIDPLGHRKQFTYKNYGPVASVTEPSGDEVRYEYDKSSWLMTVHRPGGGTTRFKYDAMGNLVSEKDPLGNKTLYSYDLSGRPISSTDAMGGVSRNKYDVLGRVIENKRPDGTTVRFKYDRMGNQTEMNDGRVPIRFSYDALGQMTRYEYPGINKALTYQYNDKGLRSRLILSDDQAIGYEYGDFQQLSAIVLPTGQKISFTYDPAGRLKTIHYPNGIIGHYNYDSSGQIEQIYYETSNSDVIYSNSNRMDAAGNVVERRDTNGKRTQYTYDPSGQLVEETGPETRFRYRYGKGGNRVELQSGEITTLYRHNAADQMIQAGAETLAYDANGNLTSRQGAGNWRYSYKTGNQLVKATGPEGIEVRYGYDPTGNRVWREDMKGRKWFLHDGLNLVQTLDADMKTEVTYIHAPGIDRPVAMLRDGKAYYYHIDYQGSVRRLTDENAKLVAAYDYDAFGNRKTLMESVDNPFAYTGRELDIVTGLYYFRARYYDPRLGRFISTDPIPAGLENAIGHNPYLYALNNPLRYNDPLGMNATDRWPFLRNAFSPGRISHWGNDILRFEYLKAKAILRGEIPVNRQYTPQTLNRVAQNLKNMEQVMRQRGILSSVKPTTTQPIPRSALPSAGSAATYTQAQALQGQRTGSHAARLGTQGISAPSTAVAQSKTSWWKSKFSNPRRGLKVGVTSAGAFSGLNFIACRYEGMTWSECASELAWGLGKSAVIGAGAGVVFASGGTAAVLVGGLVTAAGGYFTGKRVFAASAVGEQRQAEQRLAVVQQKILNRLQLSSIDARILELKQLATQIDTDKNEAQQEISKAEQAYETFKGDIEHAKMSVTKLNCAHIGTQLRKAGECLSAANELATKAEQKFGDAESLLRACLTPSQAGSVASPVPAAEQLVIEAKSSAKEAETKFQADACQLDKLAAEVSALKTKAKKIRNDFRKIDELRNALFKMALPGDKSELVGLADNHFARNAYIVDQAKEVNKMLDKIKNDSTRFENEKHELLNKIIPSLLKSWPGDSDDLDKRRQRLEKIILANMTDPEKYAKRLRKFSRVDLMSHVLGTTTESATLSACEGLDMGGVEREHQLAREALQALQPLSDRLAKIAATKQTCLAKLAQKKPPAMPQLERLAITPANVECKVGQLCPPFTLIGEYSDKSQKVIPTKPSDWWPPQPIRAISPTLGEFTVTATHGGMTATATVKIIPKPQAAKSATQQAPTGSGATPGRVELVGWGIVEPKTRKMRIDGEVPSFKFGFGYIDYGDPNMPSLYKEVTANCNPPKPGLGRRIVDCTAVDPKSASGKQYSDKAVLIVEAGDDCIGDKWRLDCDPMLLGSPMIKPTPGQRAQIEKLVVEMQTQDPQGIGQPGRVIPPEYTEPGEGSEEAEETQTQLRPPRRLTRRGVEEFIEGPLIPGREPPEEAGCNGDCTKSAVKTTADPSINEQETPAPETPTKSAKQSGKTKCQSLAYHILVEWQPMQSPYASWVTREMKICDSNKEAFQNIYPWVQEYKAAGCAHQEAVGHVYPKGDYYAGKEAEHLKEAFDDAAFWKSRCQVKREAPSDPGVGSGSGGSSIPQ